MASHMTSEIALRRSGWLKVNQPIPSALCARIFAVPTLICAASAMFRPVPIGVFHAKRPRQGSGQAPNAWCCVCHRRR